MADALFWNQLLTRSDAIASIDASNEEGRQQLLAQLNTIDETYRQAFDPVDDYEAFVTATLCRSILQALQTQHLR